MGAQISGKCGKGARRHRQRDRPQTPLHFLYPAGWLLVTWSQGNISLHVAFPLLCSMVCSAGAFLTAGEMQLQRIQWGSLTTPILPPPHPAATSAASRSTAGTSARCAQGSEDCQGTVAYSLAGTVAVGFPSLWQPQVHRGWQAG